MSSGVGRRGSGGAAPGTEPCPRKVLAGANFGCARSPLREERSTAFSQFVPFLSQVAPRGKGPRRGRPRGTPKTPLRRRAAAEVRLVPAVPPTSGGGARSQGAAGHVPPVFSFPPSRQTAADQAPAVSGVPSAADQLRESQAGRHRLAPTSGPRAGTWQPPSCVEFWDVVSPGSLAAARRSSAQSASLREVVLLKFLFFSFCQ